MKEVLLTRFAALYRAQFRDVNGAVVAFVPGTAPPVVKKKTFARPLDRAIYENGENHQHFGFAIGDSAWVRWQNNLVLACGVRDYWAMVLRKTFGRREFVMFVQNELAILAETRKNQVLIEIVPTLRLWSRRNDPRETMVRAFRVAETELHLVAVRESGKVQLISAREVFTAQREVRRSFQTRITRLGNDYAAVLRL